MLKENALEELKHQSIQVIDLNNSCGQCRFNVVQNEGDWRRWCLLFEQSLIKCSPFCSDFSGTVERAIGCSFTSKVYVLDGKGNGTGT